MRKGLIILADLKDSDLIWLSHQGTIVELSPGETLIEAGVDITHLFFVTNGALKVSVGTEVIATAGVGDILGEMSFVERRPPDASVIAKTPVRVLSVPITALLAEFASNDGFAARFYRALAVALSDRLRAMSPVGSDTELDEGILDQLHVAGDRTLRLIRLLEGTPA